MVPQDWSICLIPSTVQIRMAFCHPTANTMMKSCARRLSLRKALRPRLRLCYNPDESGRRDTMGGKDKGGKNVKKPKQDKAKKGPSGK